MENNVRCALPHGLLTIGQGSDLNKDWDGIWMAEVTRDDQGWTAEIRIPQGLGLEFTSYGLTKADRTWTNGSLDTDPIYDAGFDLSYSLTPNLRVGITVNTAFRSLSSEATVKLTYSYRF